MHNATIITFESSSLYRETADRLFLGEPSAELDLNIKDLIMRNARALSPITKNNLVKECFIATGYTLDLEHPLLNKIKEMVDRLLACGEIIEVTNYHRISTDKQTKFLFVPKPHFVFDSGSNTAYLIAIDRNHDVYELFGSSIEYRGILPVIKWTGTDGKELRRGLLGNGLGELSIHQWLTRPNYLEKNSPTRDSIYSRYLERLDQSLPSGDIQDLIVVDDSKNPLFYAGRKSHAKGLTGNFICQRLGRYGQKIWGFVKIDNGVTKKYLDFPLLSPDIRGCDEAWQLLMIKDAINHQPQQFTCIASLGDAELTFFSPVPSWIERHLMIFGRNTPKETSKSKRGLFSYTVNSQDLNMVKKYLVSLFMQESSDESRHP